MWSGLWFIDNKWMGVSSIYDDRYYRLIQVPVLSEWTLSHCNGKILSVKILFSIQSLSKFHYRKN